MNLTAFLLLAAAQSSEPSFQLLGIVRAGEGCESAHHFQRCRNGGALGDAINKAIADRVREKQDEFLNAKREPLAGGEPHRQYVNTSFLVFNSTFVSAESSVRSGHDTTFLTYNFALVDGQVKPVKFADLVANKAEAGKIASELVMARLQKNETLDLTKFGTELPKSLVDRFAVRSHGLQWSFGGTEVGAQLRGGINTPGGLSMPNEVVKISWMELGPYLDPNSPLKGMLPSN